MAAFLIHRGLSREDLKLKLSNRNGYPQDASSVRWTIYAKDGKQISGKSLPAIRRTCGEYYAPFQTDVPNGNYQITWEIQDDFCDPIIKKSENFFVVDPSSYTASGPIDQNAVPASNMGTYLSGTPLGPGDLPLFLKDCNGYPQDAYAVFWSILDAHGKTVGYKTYANRVSTGEYYAQWQVSVCSGSYKILWEFQETSFSPLQSIKMQFNVIYPTVPFAMVMSKQCSKQVSFECYPLPNLFIPKVLIPTCETISYCGYGGGSSYCPPPQYPAPAPAPSGDSCCSFEIPRTIHLEPNFLPPSSGFTSQLFYTIPKSIRKITFYVTYTRGSSGGFPALRLMWGNGVEETQETLIDSDITTSNQVSTQGMFLQELDGPVPPDGNPVSFILETTAPGGAKTVRLIACESGKPGTPGVLGITLTASTM